MTVLPPFTSKNRELLTREGACLAGSEGKELAWGWRKKLGGTTEEKSRVKTKLVQGVLRAVKCSLIRVPFFCSNDFNYWNAQFFNMQIKSLKYGWCDVRKQWPILTWNLYRKPYVLSNWKNNNYVVIWIILLQRKNWTILSRQASWDIVFLGWLNSYEQYHSFIKNIFVILKILSKKIILYNQKRWQHL